MTGRSARSAGLFCLTAMAVLLGCADRPSGSMTGADTPAIWTVDATPLRVIGGDDGVEFGGVSGVGMLRNGSIVIVDGLAPAIWLFPADGSAPLPVGRVGSGPGEFRAPQYLNVLSGDEFAIYDAAQRRVVIYGPDGSFRDNFALPAANLDSVVFPVGLLPGRELLAARTRFPRPDKSGQVFRLMAEVVGLDNGGRSRASFGTFGYGDWVSGSFNGTPISGPRFYGWKLVIANSDQFVAIGEGQTYDMKVFDTNGDSVGFIREARDPRPVSEELRDKMIAMAKANNAPANVTAPERFADSLPVIRKALIDRDGLVWILGTQPEYGGPDTVAVYRHTGQAVGTLPLPNAFRLGAVSDTIVVGISFDSNEVSSVALLRLRRGLGAE